MSKILKRIFVLITCGCLLAALTIFTILWVFSNNLPDYKFLKNYKAPVSSKVYSGEGELVSDFSSEKRIFVPYNAIPKKVIYAFLSAEDKNFFSHPGVDAKGILRAIINNISNYLSSKRLEGASTITQQVAKNFLLSNEVSLNRKIKEAILAFRIERALSKERILELYLNQIYLGQGAYGIASASLEYFDKPISKLDYAIGHNTTKRTPGTHFTWLRNPLDRDISQFNYDISKGEAEADTFEKHCRLLSGNFITLWVYKNYLLHDPNVDINSKYITVQQCLKNNFQLRKRVYEAVLYLSSPNRKRG